METKQRKELVGSLNVRGIKTEEERRELFTDAVKYKLDVITIAETHIGDKQLFNELKGKDSHGHVQEYILFSTNKENSSTHGTGILIKKCLKPDIQRITDRICTADINLKDHKVICAICATDSPHKYL